MKLNRLLKKLEFKYDYGIISDEEIIEFGMELFKIHS